MEFCADGEKTNNYEWLLSVQGHQAYHCIWERERQLLPHLTTHINVYGLSHWPFKKFITVNLLCDYQVLVVFPRHRMQLLVLMAILMVTFCAHRKETHKWLYSFFWTDSCCKWDEFTEVFTPHSFVLRPILTKNCNTIDNYTFIYWRNQTLHGLICPIFARTVLSSDTGCGTRFPNFNSVIADADLSFMHCFKGGVCNYCSVTILGLFQLNMQRRL